MTVQELMNARRENDTLTVCRRAIDTILIVAVGPRFSSVRFIQPGIDAVVNTADLVEVIERDEYALWSAAKRLDTL